MGDNPQIQLELGQVLCDVHGEPFRENWPRGFARFSVKVLTLALEDDALMREAGGEIDKVGDACKRLPLCERVAPSVLLHLYHEVGIGKRARCVNCKEIREGTPYNVTNRRTGRIERKKHLCFYCVVTNVERKQPPNPGRKSSGNGHAPR